MALTQKLELRHSQGLVMTPQLMQAIKLLQLSSLDLAAYVDAEIERNPLIERESEAAEAPARGDVAGSNGPAAADGPGGMLDEASQPGRATIEHGLDDGLDSRFSDSTDEPAPADGPAPYSQWASVGARGQADAGYNLESFVPSEKTLSEHLSEQLALAVTDPVRRIIGQHLIDLVDESGYLTDDLAAVAHKLGATRADVEAVLSILQGFDPPGICATNVADCLAIQLRERNRLDPAMQALLAHLDLFARRDFAALRKICAVDNDDLNDMIEEVRRLNPKPGWAFGSTLIQPIVPDVFVRAAADGGWLVELNSDTLPRILVNQTYYAQVTRNMRNQAEKSYLAECMQTATWLTRALDQRARTILKVASELVRQQDAFFARGVQHLRPLTLRMVADAIGMHESTVSRVTANKYLASNRGIFELKYFFTAPIAAADGGEAHSAQAVRHRIKQLIDAEAPSAILSDDTIVERLRGAGIDIARRTVAKYREGMRIPSSVQRRREKNSPLAL